MQAWITVVSWSLYFRKSVFSFRTDGILKSDWDFISNWKFPDRQAVIESTAVVYEHTKGTHKMCSPIGHNNTKHCLCPIRSRHPLEFLEMGRWESVPRGSSALTWKLSSRLFSRPYWLPLGLQGCCVIWRLENLEILLSAHDWTSGANILHLDSSTTCKRLFGKFNLL